MHLIFYITIRPITRAWLTVNEYIEHYLERWQMLRAGRVQPYEHTITGCLEFSRDGSTVLPASVIRVRRPLVNLDETLVARERVGHFEGSPANIELNTITRDVI